MSEPSPSELASLSATASALADQIHAALTRLQASSAEPVRRSASRLARVINTLHHIATELDQIGTDLWHAQTGPTPRRPRSTWASHEPANPVE